VVANDRPGPARREIRAGKEGPVPTTATYDRPIIAQHGDGRNDQLADAVFALREATDALTSTAAHADALVTAVDRELELIHQAAKLAGRRRNPRGKSR
jgi:hypothetical protein